MSMLNVPITQIGLFVRITHVLKASWNTKQAYRLYASLKFVLCAIYQYSSEKEWKQILAAGTSVNLHSIPYIKDCISTYGYIPTLEAIFDQ